MNNYKRYIIVFIILFSCITCYAQVLVQNEDDIAKIEFIWVPNRKLYNDDIIYIIEDKIRIKGWISRLNNSTVIDAKDIPFLSLLEGRYYFKIHYNNRNYEMLKVFGNGSYITDEDESQYFVNPELYNSIQQFLFYIIIYEIGMELIISEKIQ